MSDEPPTKAEHSDFMAHMHKVIETGMKLKKAILARGLRRARAKCPHCADGYLFGSINGPRNHLHMACDTCNVRMME